MVNDQEDLTRKITHEDYGKAEMGLSKMATIIEKRIYEVPKDLTVLEIKKAKIFTYATDNFIKGIDPTKLLAPIAGGCSLIMVIIFLTSLDEDLNWYWISIFILCIISTIFFAVFHFTKPKKERILNRKDGLVTIEGAYYQPNITMPFDKALFCFVTGGDDAGGFHLHMIRPKNYTYSIFGAGFTMYNDMSFFTWYMDKNRPLPPGSAFDPYREDDFERRKAAGFPKPLYPSSVPTPEATPEQQAERAKYWNEELFIDEEDGKEKMRITYFE